MKLDTNLLSSTISSLRSDISKVEQDGVWLQGEELEIALAKARARLQSELDRLELILASGITPDKYTSINTKQTYYPTSEELKLKETQILPRAKHSFFCIKQKRKDDGLKNSRIKLIQDNGSQIVSFFMEHKVDGKYPKGSFAAKVKKGSMSEGNGDPKFAVKIYHKDMFNGNSIHELRLAMRSAYCYKQLEREAYAFRNNGKQYIATEWIAGVKLNNANQAQIQSMPIPRRIIMAISLLRELNILHKQGLIHHDIKPSNVIANFGKLSFFDLVSVSLKNEKPLYGSAPLYTDAFLPSAQMAFDAIYSDDIYLKFNEKTDIYALGITLAHLFQEIYKPKPEKLAINVDKGLIKIKTFEFSSYSLQHGPKYAEHDELQKLLMNMVIQDNDKLNSCEDYIDAFQNVLKIYPGYEQYLAEDRLAHLDKTVAPQDGEKAFREIEIELLEFNQRIESVRKLSL